MLQSAAEGDLIEQEANEAIVEVTKDNPQVYFHGLQLKPPAKHGGREYYRTVTDDEFLLADPRSGEIVFSFPLRLVVLRTNGRNINSHAIRGVYFAEPNPYWQRKFEENQVLFALRGGDAEEAFTQQ